MFHETRSPSRVPERIGRMSRAEAASLAGSLCTRLTGGHCDPVEVSARATPATQTNPPLREWDVACEAPTGACSIQIDADSKELLVFQREGDPILATGDAARGHDGAGSSKGTERYARHYLALAGLPLPAGARRLPSPGTAVAFECAAVGPHAQSRLLLVRVDAVDASLEFLLNRPFRSSQGANRI
jgi:hypothetical protein